VEVLQGLRFAAFYLFDLRVLSRSCLFVPGLEQQTTQYPLRRQFTMVHEVFAVCQGREYNFSPRKRGFIISQARKQRSTKFKIAGNTNLWD